MANNYFKFKEFTLIQEVCAMKVCTDSCLFGAWVTSRIPVKGIHHILDIGTGTGLLSLMLVQKYQESKCDAIEIDKEAFEEASRNFENSRWKDKFSVFNMDFLSFQSEDKYDLIVCNPPFYEKQLISPDKKKNAAMHSTDFSIENLFSHTRSLIGENGNLTCLIPWNRTNETIESAENNGWYKKEVCYVKQTTQHNYFRTMIIFSSKPSENNIAELSIKDKDSYTPEFIKLLKDYYLFL